MDKLKGAWAWIRSNAVAILVAIVAVLGAGIFWGYHNRKIRSLETEVAIKEAHRQVAALDERRHNLAERAKDNAEVIASVQTERYEIQRRVVALDQEVAGMSDAAVEEAFRAMY